VRGGKITDDLVAISETIRLASVSQPVSHLLGGARGRDRGLDLKRIGMQRVVRLAMLAVLATSLTGCGSKPSYPTAKPVSALNQPGECAYCHGKIELVTDDNLVTCDGVQYIVCNEECAAGQKIAAGR
jgi:hypothetical protein